MITMDEHESVQRVRDELCGVSPKEVLGLLALIMKRENVKYTNTNGNKRVRRFTAKIIGMQVSLTEVNNHPMSGLSRSFVSENHFWAGIDYHIETDEWEFKVRLESTMFISWDIRFVWSARGLKATKTTTSTKCRLSGLWGWLRLIRRTSCYDSQIP